MRKGKDRDKLHPPPSLRCHLTTVIWLTCCALAGRPKAGRQLSQATQGARGANKRERQRTGGMRALATSAAALSAPSTSGRQQAAHAALAPCRLRARQQPFLGEASALRQGPSGSGRRQQRAAAVNVAEQQQAPAPPRKQQGGGAKVVKASAAAAACSSSCGLCTVHVRAPCCNLYMDMLPEQQRQCCGSPAVLPCLALSQVPPERVRNFSIIAHIDHGGLACGCFSALAHSWVCTCACNAQPSRAVAHACLRACLRANLFPCACTTCGCRQVNAGGPAAHQD